MKLIEPKIDWLLRGSPRLVQIEALSRSMYGVIQRDDAWSDINFRGVPAHPMAEPARGWAHFMQQRLGKTPTALNEFMLMKRDWGIRYGLIFSPNTYKGTWAMEARDFGVDVPVYVFESSDNRELEMFLSRNPEALVVVNYEALVYPKNIATLMKMVGDNTAVWADESIVLKNPNSKTFRQALELGKYCRFSRPMSGKPVTQGPHDLWGQLRFAKQLSGNVYYAFRGKYCKMGGFQGKRVIGTKNESQLHEFLETCSFNARRSDWLKTPGADYYLRPIEMLPNQRRIYEDMEKDFLAELEDGSIVEADQIIGRLLKQQQISSGFVYDEYGDVKWLMPHDQNPKLMDIRYLLENEVTCKVFIVAHYKPSVDALLEVLAPFNPVSIRGRNDMEMDVDQAKAIFNNDPSCRVVVGQERAVKFGHTLMGNPDDPCLYTMYYENTYSLDDRDQSEQRNQGSGQVKPITILDYYASPFDLGVIKALQAKEDVASVVLNYDRSTGLLPDAIN